MAKEEKKQGQQDCLGCGAKPPHKHEPPFDGHKAGCPLVAEWARAQPEQRPVVEVTEIACVRRKGAYVVEVRRTVNGKPEAEVVRSSTDKRIAADKALAAILEAWR